MSVENCVNTGEGPDVTGLLARWGHGDPEALGELMSAAYVHLHQLAERAMRSERRDHTLQATALVHEAFLRLAEAAPPVWRDRGHFYAVTARLMRRILVDHARHLAAERHGGGWHKITLGDMDGARDMPQVDLLALDEALRRLARVDARKVRVIELRFFGGLSVAETAEILSVSEPTVVLDTRLARAWLYTRIQGTASAS
ncbi:MAG: RNA polymerase subunit sigma-70 [bacterium]|nr:RNA polymerase subunit sigma-70 [bacterium]